MAPIQQMLLGVGAKKKTYLDDVFSTYVYTGNGNSGSSQSINNGIDLSGEGGLVWFKPRESNDENELIDTIRGRTKRLRSDTNEAQATIGNASGSDLLSFNNNGFTGGQAGLSKINWPGEDIVSWTFRKAPGFFDVVTWTGNGSNRTIAHSLGSVPGCIMVKCTSNNHPWQVYHRGTDSSSPEDYALILNANDAREDYNEYWNDTAPTSSVFSLGTDPNVNGSSKTYVAYLFAGGESTAATARSVDFTPNSNASLTLSGHSDLDAGTGDYSVEGWINTTFTGTTRQNIFHSGGADNGSLYVGIASDQIYVSNYNAYILQANTGYAAANPSGQWIHVAACRSGSTLKIFKNGIEVASGTDSGNYTSSSGNTASIGFGGAMGVKGKLSNVRFVKGTAVYTSSFRPPTKPLTNITNTKLLCCNNSSASGATVTPNTITVNHSAAASTDSPFDDPAAFTFGGKENVIKCGSYVGNGSSTGPEINLGWEPSWLLIKRSSGTEDWMLFDNIRTSDRTNMHLDDFRPNSNSSEGDGAGGDSNSFLNWTSTGFKLQSNTAHTNDADDTYVFMAIRRSDGYCGKPPELGSGCFQMDTGAGSSTTPNFDSNFPVDFAFFRNPSVTDDWIAGTRLMGAKEVKLQSNGGQNGSPDNTWDSNTGWNEWSPADSAYQSWMFKRHAGFDVQTYTGVSGTATRPHSMGVTPEMIWVKRRNASELWCVGHKDLNGGTNPWEYYLRFTTNAAYSNNQFYQAPTSTHWSTNSGGLTNNNGDQYIAMLFASVDGISKVGSYTGSSSTVTVTTGFQPRFLIIKKYNDSDNAKWIVLDTTRGWGSGNDQRIYLNSTESQETGIDVGAPTATGFTLTPYDTAWSDSNQYKYIYYAHA